MSPETSTVTPVLPYRRTETTQIPTISQLKEDGWVHGAQNGNEQAFQNLYEHVYPRLLRYCFSLTRNHDRAEDLASETMLQVCENLGTYECKGKPIKNWGVTIAHNIFVNSRKRNNLEITGAGAAIVLDSTPDVKPFNSDPAHTVPERIDQQQTLLEIKKLLRSLSPAEERTIRLRFFEELSYEEIAQMTGKTRGAIRITNHRGLAKLRKMLQEQQ